MLKWLMKLVSAKAKANPRTIDRKEVIEMPCGTKKKGGKGKGGGGRGK